MPLVSVVMPSYNHEEFIAESIESVLGQDFDDFELIIIDDASTDASRQVIQKYEAQDVRVRVIVHKANRGMAETINDGIDAATGEFIAFTASDDVWIKDKLSKQLAVIASDKNLILWSEGLVIDKNGQPTGKSFSEIHGSVSRKKSGNIFQELLKGNFIFGTTLLFKKQHIEGIRYDASLMYLTDYKFALELARTHEFHYIAEPLAQYRIHGRNTLIGSGPDTTKWQYAEEASILQEALRRFNQDIPRATKASIYSTLGFIYRELGENREAISSFLQAIRFNPLNKANRYYLLSILRLARAASDLQRERNKND